VIYTADHGQSVLESLSPRGRLERAPHATLVDPPRTQALVPVVLLGLHPDVEAALRARYDPALRDRVSGFELFSTALVAMGYDETALRRFYPPSLFDRDADRGHRVFLSGSLFGLSDAFALNPVDARAPAAPARP
jgi:hypothetical protein